MAINDTWEYTRSAAELTFVVYGVSTVTGEAHARAAFYLRTAAEAYALREAEVHAAGPDWGIAVEDSRDGKVLWTSF